MVWLGLVAIVSACGVVALAQAWLTGKGRSRPAPPSAQAGDPHDPPEPPFRADPDDGPRIDPLLILRQAVDKARPQALAARVTLLAPDPAGGFAIGACPDALSEVLDALLAAAIRRNRPHGVVLAELRQTADGVAVRVHDTGCGFEAHALPRLFHGDTAPASGGLHQARRLTRAMGGRLTAASTPAHGSTLTLWLPGAAPDDRRASLLPQRDPVLSSAVVLYVEPDPTSLALVRQILSALGATLHVSPDGEEGLTLARDLRPDLIVIEPNLPGMDGFKLKASLDADPLTRGLPVVALSFDPDPALARRGRQAGFAGWMTKPLDIGLFTAALRRLLAEDPTSRAARTSRSRELA